MSDPINPLTSQRDIQNPVKEKAYSRSVKTIAKIACIILFPITLPVKAAASSLYKGRYSYPFSAPTAQTP